MTVAKSPFIGMHKKKREEERPGSDVSGSECEERAVRAIALQDQKLPSDLVEKHPGIWMAVADENTPMGADIMLSTRQQI